MYPSPIQNLIDLFSEFPGVGPRQAARFVFFLLKEVPDYRDALSKGISEISEMLFTCPRCGNIEAKKWSPEQSSSASNNVSAHSIPEIDGAEPRTKSHVPPNKMHGSLVPGEVNKNTCAICANTKRNQRSIAVVEDVTGLRALEHARTYHGMYHVLSGSILGKKGALHDDAPIKKLVLRIKEESPEEIIIATSPTYEGDAMARYLMRELAALHVKVTRLARGLAKGVDLEYVDEETLREALEGRR